MNSESLTLPATHDVAKHLRFNFVVSLLDGGFFGAALGFASFVTVIPLFVNNFTNSAILIGLIPALHTIGWQLPQLFTAGWVSRLQRYKPMTVLMTMNERVPFLGMAVLAWFSQSLSPNLVLVFAFLLLAWQGLGGGFTATAWQSMIGKIIPKQHYGKFFGLQSATSNSFASVGAVVAGILLLRIDTPANFALCFFIAAVCMGISWFFLGLTRESSHAVQDASPDTVSLLKQAGHVLKRDRNFSWFVVARTIAQFATAATAFYTIYAVRAFAMNPGTAGIMTSVLLAAQIISSPLMGGLGDRFGHRAILIFGTLAALAGALLAWRATSLEWFYLVFALAGIANAAMWTTSIAMTLAFGGVTERPVYVGLANTLIVPATIAAPIIGGWIADTFGFGMTFLFSVICAVLTAAILYFCVRDAHTIRTLGSAENSAAQVPE